MRAIVAWVVSQQEGISSEFGLLNVSLGRLVTSLALNLRRQSTFVTLRASFGSSGGALHEIRARPYRRPKVTRLTGSSQTAISILSTCRRSTEGVSSSATTAKIDSPKQRQLAGWFGPFRIGKNLNEICCTFCCTFFCTSRF